MSRTTKILLVIVLTVLVGAGLIFWKFWPKKSNSSPTTTASKAGLFGTMIAFNINDATKTTPSLMDTLSKGWTQFRKDNSAYQNLLGNLEKLITDRAKLVKATGFSIDRGSFGYFTWNVIEPQKGQFDWELTDLYAKGASGAGEKISAVIQPYAAWDQTNTAAISGCQALDFAYYDYKAGPPNDMTEYENFLTKTVERYKGKVAVWEIGNEPDASCSGYQNNPQAYFDLLKISSETIKKADPAARVTNGGASGFADNNNDEKSFWTKFFALGGGQYIDYFNLHYNTDRSANAKLDPAAFQETLTIYNNLMDQSAPGGGGRKPLYLTEFGIYSGAPSSPPGGQPAPPADGPSAPATAPDPKQVQNNLTNLSQDAQAALYFQDSILAFANGADFVFIDLIGSDNDSIGSSMAFNTDGQPRLFLGTLKTIATKLGDFSKPEKITDGQYKFSVNGKTIYALWSGTLPSEISGQVKVTGLKGQEQTLDATGIKLSSDQPVLVEGI